MLLSASTADGTLSHLSSEHAEDFLQGKDDIKFQFLNHCLKSKQVVFVFSSTVVDRAYPTGGLWASIHTSVHMFVCKQFLVMAFPLRPLVRYFENLSGCSLGDLVMQIYFLSINKYGRCWPLWISLFISSPP